MSTQERGVGDVGRGMYGWGRQLCEYGFGVCAEGSPGFGALA